MRKILLITICIFVAFSCFLKNSMAQDTVKVQISIESDFFWFKSTHIEGYSANNQKISHHQRLGVTAFSSRHSAFSFNLGLLGENYMFDSLIDFIDMKVVQKEYRYRYFTLGFGYKYCYFFSKLGFAFSSNVSGFRVPNIYSSFDESKYQFRFMFDFDIGPVFRNNFVEIAPHIHFYDCYIDRKSSYSGAWGFGLKLALNIH